jgi:YesN/AraC family two-component response regulator
MNNTILITGASSGLGKATAKLFQSKGWNVVATMRNPENETELTTLKNILVTKLDVLDLRSLLKKETGKNTQDHIHFYLIEEAKSILLSTDKSVEEIAYTLGFEYPQYFNKLFKQKTGKTPIEFRSMN